MLFLRAVLGWYGCDAKAMMWLAVGDGEYFMQLNRLIQLLSV
jgi:hypothetical protein